MCESPLGPEGTVVAKYFDHPELLFLFARVGVSRASSGVRLGPYCTVGGRSLRSIRGVILRASGGFSISANSTASLACRLSTRLEVLSKLLLGMWPLGVRLLLRRLLNRSTRELREPFLDCLHGALATPAAPSPVSFMNDVPRS